MSKFFLLLSVTICLMHRLKVFIKWLLLTLLTAGVLLAGYYFLILKPRLALPKALLESQQILGEFHEVLLQNRIALTELTRLDPSTSDFFDEKQRSLTRLNETNQAALKLANNPPPLPKKTTNELNDLKKAYPSLTQQTKTLLELQQSLIKKLNLTHELLENIYRYDPVVDLEDLDINNPTDKEELTSRLNAALEGLDNIKSGLRTIEGSDDLIAEISQIQSLIDQLKSKLEKNQDSATETRSELVTKFIALKKSCLEKELTLVKSEDSIDFITRLTNLILEYEFHIQLLSSKLQNN